MSELRYLRFGPFRLDRRERLLMRDGQPAALPPKAVDLLIALTAEPGALRTKEELLAQVWPDVVVDESNLSQTIFVLRKALGDDDGQWIATVPRRGYRFSGKVSADDSAAMPAPAEAQGSEPNRRWNRSRLVIAAAIAVILIAAATIAIIKLRKRHQGDAIHSIAVLPFRPLDEQRGDRPLELGIADTLITKLSVLPDLIIAPTRAVAAFVDHPVDSLAAGRTLDVDGVVEGSIQRVGQRIRCNVRLLRVSDGRAILADEYDEDASDLFVLEDRIAQRVADALDLRLSGRNRRDLARHSTKNAEAYQLYTQGRFQWNMFDQAGFLSSIRYYEAALRLDPRYADAWAGLANSYSVIGIYGPLPREESFMKAREAALRALALDPDLANAHAALGGSGIFYTHNWREADEELHRALASDPNDVDAHSLRAYLLQAFARPEEAIAEVRRAHEIDPTWIVPRNDLLKSLFFARRFDESIAEGRRAISLEPRNRFALNNTAFALISRGQRGQAAQLASAALAIAPNDARAVSNLGVIAARAGDRATAQKQIETLRQLRTHGDWRTDYEIATVYAALGDNAAAFVALDDSLASHYPFIFEVHIDPRLDPLHNDPRFAPFLAKLGLDQR
ncbi:MAG TPA: winged helix-turn-helix domain-containing protein [Thermoanaerobaculia bacterium]|nr:winged helix-turn-helix domain-containing protein [Thermoanaerobaculia bacterium]